MELSAAAAAGEEAPDEEPLINADRKLLVLLSNCAFVRGSIMPSLIDRCAAPTTCILCQLHGSIMPSLIDGYYTVARCHLC